MEVKCHHALVCFIYWERVCVVQASGGLGLCELSNRKWRREKMKLWSDTGARVSLFWFPAHDSLNLCKREIFLSADSRCAPPIMPSLCTANDRSGQQAPYPAAQEIREHREPYTVNLGWGGLIIKDHQDLVSGYFWLRNLNRQECNDPYKIVIDNHADYAI